MIFKKSLFSLTGVAAGLFAVFIFGSFVGSSLSHDDGYREGYMVAIDDCKRDSVEKALQGIKKELELEREIRNMPEDEIDHALCGLGIVYPETDCGG